MTVLRAATLRTFFFAILAGAKELKNKRVYAYCLQLLCELPNLPWIMGLQRFFYEYLLVVDNNLSPKSHDFTFCY